MTKNDLIPWPGGEMPVAPTTRVILQFSDGPELHYDCLAGDYAWDAVDDQCRIVAYAVDLESMRNREKVDEGKGITISQARDAVRLLKKRNYVYVEEDGGYWAAPELSAEEKHKRIECFVAEEGDENSPMALFALAQLRGVMGLTCKCGNLDAPGVHHVAPDAKWDCFEAYEGAGENAPDLQKMQRVIDAAVLWTYCPDAGGYKEGSAIEDTCEALGEVVEDYTGVRRESIADEWITEEESAERLKKAGYFGGRRNG